MLDILVLYYSQHGAVRQLAQLIAEESRFAEMGPALEVLYALWQRDDSSGMPSPKAIRKIPRRFNSPTWRLTISPISSRNRASAPLNRSTKSGLRGATPSGPAR